MAGSIVSFDRFNGGAPLSVFARATLQTDPSGECACIANDGARLAIRMRCFFSLNHFFPFYNL